MRRGGEQWRRLHGVSAWLVHVQRQLRVHTVPGRGQLLRCATLLTLHPTFARAARAVDSMSIPVIKHPACVITCVSVVFFCFQLLTSRHLTAQLRELPGSVC